MINKINIIKFMIIFFILICCSLNSVSYAETIETNIMGNGIINEFKPGKNEDPISKPFNKLIVRITNSVLKIVQIFGAVLFVMSLALAGLNIILGSGEGVANDLGLNIGDVPDKDGKTHQRPKKFDKGTVSKIIRRSAIGSIFLFASASIVRIVFWVFSNL